MLQIVDNAGATIPPKMPDGTSFPFALDNGTRTGFSDSHSELLELLIPGYASLAMTDAGANEAFEQRVMYAARFAGAVQAAFLAEAGERDEISKLTEDELNLLFADKGDRQEIEEWTADVPFVLVDVLYGDRTTPSGRLVWIHAADELSLIKSVEALGYCEYGTVEQ